MKKRHYTCENCGAELIIDAKADSGKCEYCGSVYYIDKQKPAEIHHYFGNVKITPPRVVAVISLAVILASAIVVLALYFAGVFTPAKPPVSEEFRHGKAVLYEGTYLVGKDIQPGEYAAFKAPSAERGRISMLTERNAGVGTSLCKADYRFANNLYFTAEEGLYIRVEDCNVFKVGDKKVEPLKDGSFEGIYMLRGGTDIAVGDYVISNSDTQTGQYTKVKCVIGGKDYEKVLGFRTYLNIAEGDYIYLTYGKLWAESEAPEPTKGENGKFLQGQYKVGKDIRAGRYEFDCGNACSVAYFVHNSDGFAFFDKDDMKKPSEQPHYYIDLKDGDYIYLYKMNLKPYDGDE